MTTADHRETGRAVEVGRARERGDGTLCRVDEVGIEILLRRSRPHTQEAVLGVEEDFGVRSQESGNQVRNPDAEIHDLPRPELLSGARGDQRLRFGAHERATR